MLLFAFLILLLSEIPTVAPEFTIIVIVRCDSYCNFGFRHGNSEYEYLSVLERTARFTRHFDEPVQNVTIRMDNFFNVTDDFMPVSSRYEWTCWENRTFMLKEDGLWIFGHYTCPEEKCQFDHERIEYNQKINQWSVGLVLAGIFFFLLISGSAEAVFKWTRKMIRNRKDQLETYNSLELIDMSKRNANLKI